MKGKQKMRKMLTAAFAAIMTGCMTPGVIFAQNFTQEEVREFLKKPPRINTDAINPEYQADFKKDLRAAHRGDAKAQYNVGICYDLGKGVARNKIEATKWYRKAAEQGLAEAQYNLGICFKDGDGVIPNKAEAVKWFRKAAAQGFANAQYSLGVCYANGEGVEQNEETAVEWLRKAARQGYKDAQQILSQAGLSW